MSTSTVTYTSISSDYEEPSDAGSLGFVVYGYDGLPMHPVDTYVEAALQVPEQAPSSPDYVPGPEHPPSPDYVLEAEYLEHLVPSDVEAPMEDQPLPDDASPAGLSPGYEDESTEDDDDEEEKHLAPADSTAVASLAMDPVPSAEETELFETDESATTPPPPPAYRTTSKMSVRTQTPIPFPSKAEIPLPSLPLPSPSATSLTYAEAPLGYRTAEIRWKAASPPTHHPSEIPSPPLLLLSTTHKDDPPEADMPIRKRAYFTAPTGRFGIEESSSAVAARQAGHTLAHRVDYGFIDTMDANIRAVESRADDRALLGAQVSILMRERRYFSLMASSYERKAVIARHALSHSESRIQAMEAQIRALKRDVTVLQRQRIRDEDRLTTHIHHDHDRFRDLVRAAEAGLQDGPEDKMPPKKRTTTTTITTTPMIDAQLKALIAQRVADALVEIEANKTSRNGDDNHDSGAGSRRTERPARECTYSDFLKCQPLNFKGTEELEYGILPSSGYIVLDLVSVVIGGRMHIYAVSSLMDIAYWLSEQCVNGERKGYFRGGMGLRQGDPISPYLFTLVMEVLTLMMARKVQENPSFKYHVGCKELKLTYICFADDLLVLSHGSTSSIKVRKEALNEFSKTSGLLPNMSKSVPLITKSLGINECKGLVEKVIAKINDWKNKYLSFIGRLQLIAYVLSSMQVYWASFFLLPKSTMKEIDKVLKGFLWCQGEYKNRRANHIWNIAARKESLWVKWVNIVKWKDKSVWEMKGEKTDSWMWNVLAKLKDQIRPCVFHKIGNGRSTSLWYDRWGNNDPMYFLIPKWYRNAARLGNNMTVAEMIHEGNLCYQRVYTSFGEKGMQESLPARRRMPIEEWEIHMKVQVKTLCDPSTWMMPFWDVYSGTICKDVAIVSSQAVQGFCMS
uniref:Reverse transcriptase domain-containing protein n=1 Tax=Tanacetum cinerariifolium TaxID=118510 RepID=A0A6L2J0P6_TANCI|nr:hypothetical protein [Tanacetum cinerariifolium]